MFPIRDVNPSRRTPAVCFGLIAANVAVYLWQLSLPERALEAALYTYGAVPAALLFPAEAARHGLPDNPWWSPFTCMFVHGGLLHLALNLWTLRIFGDNVEDRMGPARFLGFYLACGLAASAMHIAANPTSALPVVGASGAIAGVLGAYVVLYPWARLVCIVPIVVVPVLVQVPAAVFVAIWFLGQFLNGAASLGSADGGAGIAWWAHIGGFVCGMLLHRRFLAPARRPPPLPRGAT